MDYQLHPIDFQSDETGMGWGGQLNAYDESIGDPHYTFDTRSMGVHSVPRRIDVKPE